MFFCVLVLHADGLHMLAMEKPRPMRKAFVGIMEKSLKDKKFPEKPGTSRDLPRKPSGCYLPRGMPVTEHFSVIFRKH